MRKLFLLVVIVMAAITASAQEGIYLGGGISLWRNNDVAYIIHSGFISGYQNRYGDNLKPPTNVYHRMTA